MALLSFDVKVRVDLNTNTQDIQTDTEYTSIHIYVSSISKSSKDLQYLLYYSIIGVAY